MFSRATYDSKGGMETVFKKIVAGLKAKGYKVTPVYHSNCDDMIDGGQFEDHWEIKLQKLRNKDGFLKIFSLFKFITSLFYLGKLLNSIKPNVVNCHYIGPTSFYFALLKPVFGYTLILSFHGSDVFEATKFNRAISKLQFYFADHVVGVSENLCSVLREWSPYKNQVKCIHNGVDFAFWSQCKRESQAKFITTVGALRTVKGHDILVEAFDKISTYHPDVNLLIIGDGPQRSALEGMINDKNLKQRVFLTGELDKQQIRNYFAESLLFVFPSRFEGFGIALLEAMASGLPVISTEVGGIPEILTKGTGVLIPKDNPERLKEEMEVFLKNPDLRKKLSNEAFKRAKTFDWNQTIMKYESLF